MKNNQKHHYLLVVFGVVLFVVLLRLGTIFSWLTNIISVLMPLFLGFIIAFILNVPMRGIERLIDRLRKKKDKEINLKLKRGISFSITILLLLGIISLVGVVVIPKLIDSIVSIYDLIISKWPYIVKWLEDLGIDATLVQSWIDQFDLKELIGTLSQNTLDLFGFIFKFVGSTVSGIVSLGIGFVIAIYILFSKESLVYNTKKFINAHIKEKTSHFIFLTAKLVDEKYTKFLSGQCVEACILGILMLIILSILGIPYASLIAVFTAFCAFIPYVGAFLSWFIGAFLILLADSSKVIIYIIAYVITQFVENQFIYPHVVGTSVGLSALWTIIAVFIGSKLFGLFGMIFFIPLFAVIVELVNRYTEKKLEDNRTNVTMSNNN